MVLIVVITVVVVALVVHVVVNPLVALFPTVHRLLTSNAHGRTPSSLAVDSPTCRTKVCSPLFRSITRLMFASTSACSSSSSSARATMEARFALVNPHSVAPAATAHIARRRDESVVDDEGVGLRSTSSVSTDDDDDDDDETDADACAARRATLRSIDLGDATSSARTRRGAPRTMDEEDISARLSRVEMCGRRLEVKETHILLHGEEREREITHRWIARISSDENRP